MTIVQVYQKDSAPFELGREARFFDVRNKITFAKFEPALLLDNQPVDCLHFSFLTVQSEGLFFHPFEKLLNFENELKVQKIIVVEAEPNPIPESLNRCSPNGQLMLQLFFQDKMTNEVKFLSSDIHSFKSLHFITRQILKDLDGEAFDLGSLKAGIVTASSPNPILKPFHDVFSDATLASQPDLILVILSAEPYVIFTIDDKRYASKNISPVPRAIALWAGRKLKSGTVLKENERFYRQIIKIAINDGVPVDLLARLGVEEGDNDNPITCPQSYRRVVLHLNRLQMSDDELNKVLEIPLRNYKLSIRHGTNEATLCGIFWNEIMSHFFNTGETAEYSFVQEWKTRELYADSNRRVDLVAMMAGDFSDIPILAIESGKDDFNWENQHKDFSKLMEILSANCMKLAQKLVDRKINPELARVYGILFGGYRLQLCVAQARRIKVPGQANQFCLHAEISFRNHWFLNLISSEADDANMDCLEACCQNVESPNSNELIEIEEPIQNLTTLDFFSPPIERGNHPMGSLESEEVLNNDSADNEILELSLASEPHITCLKKLERFVQIIKGDLRRLRDARPSTHYDVYLPPRFRSQFSQSYNVATGETPTKRRLEIENVPVNRAHPASRISYSRDLITFYPYVIEAKFEITKKKSNIELEIYRQCWINYPSNFARLLNLREFVKPRTGEDMIEFTFEGLARIFDLEKILYLSNLVGDSPKATLIGGVKFMLDCLFGLYLLHRKLGYLHLDICPDNVLFSVKESLWKMVNFENGVSMKRPGFEKLSDSLSGKEGFIAPECLKDFVCSEASDVYSLGRVFDEINFKCLMKWADRFEVEKLPGFPEFKSIITEMTRENPQDRPIVTEALKQTFALLQKLLPDEKDPINTDQIFISTKNLLDLLEEEEEEKKKATEVQRAAPQREFSTISVKTLTEEFERLQEPKEPETKTTIEQQ